MIRKPFLMLAAAAAFISITAAPLHAIRPDKPRKGGRISPERVLGRFDRDANGSIDSSEAERVRRLFDTLKTFDKNADGTLSDAELSGVKVEKRRGPKKAR